MKRDMELVKNILFYVEEHDQLPTNLDGYDANAVKYHVRLLIEAELMRGVAMTTLSGEIILQESGHTRLTMAGHEFIDAARSDTIWNKAMAKVKAAGGAVTFSALTELLKKLVAQNLGL